MVSKTTITFLVIGFVMLYLSFHALFFLRVIRRQIQSKDMLMLFFAAMLFISLLVCAISFFLSSVFDYHYIIVVHEDGEPPCFCYTLFFPYMLFGVSSLLNLGMWINFVIGTRLLASHAMSFYNSQRTWLLRSLVCAIFFLQLIPDVLLSIHLCSGLSLGVFRYYRCARNVALSLGFLYVGVTLLWLL